MMGEINYKRETNNQIDDTALQGLITNLNILIKNILIYPPGHTAVSRAVEQLSKGLPDVFVNRPFLTINAIKNNLLANGIIINPKNVHVQNFAIFISKLGIASFTLKFGLTANELEHFCRLALSVPPQTYIYQQKKILEEINSLPHLKIREIDLSTIRFIDENTVPSIKRGTGVTMWQEFMLGCLSPELRKIRDPSLLESIRMYEQGSLPSFLQAFEIPADRILHSYNALIKELSNPASTADKTEKERETFFKTVHEALGKLNPDLKEKMLTVTFETLNSSADEQSLKKLLKCIPGDMIVDVLSQAVLDKKVISPTFIKLLSIMYRAGKQEEGTTAKVDRGSRAVWSRIEELFSRKGYEKYLTEDYAEQLLNLSLESDSNQADKPANFSCQKYQQAFQDRAVNRHLSSALLFLMKGDIEESLYSSYASIISQLIPELLETGDYNYLLVIYRFLQKQLKVDSSPDVARITMKAMHLFLDSSFSEKLTEDYKTPGREPTRELEELIIINGSQNIPWLLGQYLAEEDMGKKLRLFNLICHFGPRSAEYALSRLSDSNSKETVELLRLIQNCSPTTSSVEIFNLLKSNRLEVQLEAIKTLVMMKDPRAEKALLEMLLSSNKETARGALKIARDYRVHSLAQALVGQIKTLYITQTTLARNRDFLSLLGTFGSTDTLPGLEKIARTRFSFTPLRLQQTLEHLFKTLAGYSKSSTGELIRMGLRSKNANIRAICENLSLDHRIDNMYKRRPF